MRCHFKAKKSSNISHTKLKIEAKPLGGQGVRVPSLTAKNCQNLGKRGKTSGKTGKRGENSEKKEKSERFFHFAPPDR